ncbi:MAG: HlyD family efflux transporter periplasmic adaptor subunit [Pseudomonadota bacterium]
MRFLTRSLMGLLFTSLTVGLIAFAGGLVWNAVEVRRADEGRGFAPRERVFAVNTVIIAARDIRPTLNTFGEVVSRRSVAIKSPARGEVIWTSEALIEGGRVAAGAPLFRIDPTDAQDALVLVEADVRDAQIDLEDARASVLLAQDELTAAEEQAELRDRALVRQRDLETRGVGTAQAIETAELAASSARQAILTRRGALQAAGLRLAQTESRLERLAIAQAEAERNLDDTEITAPFAGLISNARVAQGQVVGEEVLLDLIDPTTLEVAFRVSTAEYLRLTNDAGNLSETPITAKLDVFGVDLTVPGVVTRESPAVGEGQTGRLLFAALEASGGLRDGDFVSISLDEAPLRGVAQVPAAALGARGTVLALGPEGRLEEVPVTLVRRQGEDVLIRAPNVAGRQIVAQRSPLLGAGIKVRPITPEGGAAEEAPDFVELTPERRAALIAFIESNTRMPAEAKARVLAQLSEDQVPARVVERIEGRMGG